MSSIAVLEGLQYLLELCTSILHDELEKELLLLPVLLVHPLDVPLKVHLADFQRLLHLLNLADQRVHGRLLLLVQDLQLLFVDIYIK